jgi:WD40 repeat protein
MSMVGLHSEVSAGIKALAWSPHPAQRHLLALGLSTGRTQILTLSPSSLAMPLRGGQTTHSALLTVKHSRAVSSLAFSGADPLLLATGYDRHRSDYSLLIWDIADAIAAFPPDPEGDATWQRPPERLEPGNLHGRGGDGVRHLQQYCASEAVHSLAWVPGSAHELLAGANNKALRLYDLRSPTRDAGGVSGGAVVHWATRAVHFVTPDPQKKQRLASVEAGPGGSVVRLWDVRRPGQELASFEVADPSGVVALEWTGGTGQTGLGVGTREGGVNVWEVVSGGERADGADNWTYCGGVRHGTSGAERADISGQAQAAAPELHVRAAHQVAARRRLRSKGRHDRRRAPPRRPNCELRYFERSSRSSPSVHRPT